MKAIVFFLRLTMQNNWAFSHFLLVLVLYTMLQNVSVVDSYQMHPTE